MTGDTVRRLTAATVLASGLVVAGCSTNPATQDLCANSKDLTSAVAGVKALKPDGAKLDELGTKIDAALAKLDRLQGVSESRYDDAISTLRTNLTALKESVVAAGNEAFSTAAPQLTAALKDVSTAYAALNQSLATQCPAG